ncbi:unnamed protein product [Soboliphyme baturini]|uniref:RNase H domain-containing protein n=1 Tax=Soboliphyme baturini TaxID=241478 RepID=A0A183J3P5_9BILA|nr:unnamed protein product [Soboliphyme baturini]
MKIQSFNESLSTTQVTTPASQTKASLPGFNVKGASDTTDSKKTGKELEAELVVGCAIKAHLNRCWILGHYGVPKQGGADVNKYSNTEKQISDTISDQQTVTAGKAEETKESSKTSYETDSALQFL